MKNATNPDRVRFAIFQQNDPTDKDCVDFSSVCAAKGSNSKHPICSRKNCVKVFRVDAKFAKGPLWARSVQDTMMELKDSDDGFVMQIDCHSLFVKDWDEKVLKIWYLARNEYAVITYYPRDVTSNMVPNLDIGNNDFIVAFGKFTFDGKYGMPRIKHAAQIKHPLVDKKQPLLVPFFGGGFSFSKAHRVQTVKNDPFLPYIFDGEEILMSARLWTHGYDFYAPSEDIIFHYYRSQEKTKRPTFWDISKGKAEKIGKESSHRLRVLLKMKEVLNSEPNMQEIDKYGMGNKRSLAMFYKMLGVNPLTLDCKDIQNTVYNGDFHKKHAVIKTKGEQHKFKGI